MNKTCDKCAELATTVGIYGDGPQSPRVYVCDWHLLPCTHPADPYASYANEMRIEDDIVDPFTGFPK